MAQPRAELRRRQALAITWLLLQLLVTFTSACTSSDRAALLAFKAGTNREKDFTGILNSWVEGGNCCKFYGVSCNSQGRVASLTIVVPPIGSECDGEDVLCPNLQRADGVTNLVGTTLANLPALEVLYLGNVNFLEDATPTGLSKLKKLRSLRLEDGRLEGPVADDLGRITSLTTLSLRGNPSIVGPLPASLCQLAHLETLDLSGYPTFFGFLNGSLPACIGRLRHLQHVRVPYNHLGGRLPASLSGLRKLKELNVSGNEFSGPLPVLPIPSLRVLNLDGNNFVGTIPALYGSLTSLVDLRLGGLNVPGEVTGLTSQLQGQIPTQLGNLKKIQVLRIRATKIHGVIPPSFSSLFNLVDLELDHNRLTAPVPDFTKLPKLDTLDLLGNLF